MYKGEAVIPQPAYMILYDSMVYSESSQSFWIKQAVNEDDKDWS
jgi:hypothetical protein